LNLGIDASALCASLTGIGWSVVECLNRMLNLDATLVCRLYTSRPLVTEFRSDRVQVRMTRPWGPIPGTFWRQLIVPRLARRDGLDCYWGPSHLLPVNLHRSVKTVLTVNDLVALYYPESMTRYNAFVHQRLFRKSVARADAIIAISDRTKQDLVAELGVEPDRITVIHLGVEESFHPLPAETVRPRLAGLGVSGDYLLSVGTLEPRKNYPLLIRALARITGKPALVIAGGRGWKYREVLREIERQRLQSQVRLLGYLPRDDLVTLYNGARMLVLPSIYEGFGLPLLQGMACGTPVLASNTSSLPEIGGDAAAYFVSQSEDSLVAELTRLLNDPAELDAMRRRGCERARRFTWERTAEQTLGVLRAVLSSRNQEPGTRDWSPLEHRR
jgi:glycosyltransferase involved in cell wall biosynthesis